MKYLHNPRCRKSREALELLRDRGINVEITEYLSNPLEREELEEIIDKLEISPYELIRRGEAVFKEKYKNSDPEEVDWIGAMIEHPKLMERPILVSGGKAIIGRPPERVLDIV